MTLKEDQSAQQLVDLVRFLMPKAEIVRGGIRFTDTNGISAEIPLSNQQVKVSSRVIS